MTTDHGQRTTDDIRSVTTCPECRYECANYAELQEHCAQHPLCEDTVRRLLALAEVGLRECPRCGLPILGEVHVSVDGWVHRACMTAAERAQIEAEGVEYMLQVAAANTDPRLVGLPGKRQSSVARGQSSVVTGQSPVAGRGTLRTTDHGPRTTDQREVVR